MNEQELKMQTALTQAFIDADRTVLQFVRKVKVSDGAGGKKTTVATPLTPQGVKVVRLGGSAPERTTEDGRAVTPSIALICYPTTNVARFDEFLYDGAKWQVVYVSGLDYELRAEVAYVG